MGIKINTDIDKKTSDKKLIIKSKKKGKKSGSTKD